MSGSVYLPTRSSWAQRCADGGAGIDHEQVECLGFSGGSMGGVEGENVAPWLVDSARGSYPVRRYHQKQYGTHPLLPR